MLRGFTTLLGIGLLILWVAGLSSPYSPGWLVWLDGLAGIAAFFAAARLNAPQYNRSAKAMGPVFLSLGLFALWIIALATDSPSWLTWWTFAFACAFMGVGAAIGSSRAGGMPGKTGEEDRDRFRRSA